MPDLDLISFGEPQVIEEGSSYLFQWQRDDQPLMGVRVDDVRNEGENIYADITVWWLLDQPIGVRPVQPKTQVKLNTANHQGWRSIPKAMKDRFENVDFEGAFTIVVDESIKRFEKGTPTTSLWEQPRSTDAPFLLKPWISATGNSILYGEGGLSKSLISLGMAISVSSGAPIFGKEPAKVGPVIIFDYEDDHQTHTDRLLAICRSFGIPPEEAEVYHHSLSAKVMTAKQEMQRRITETGAILGILDSVGMGRGGSAVAAEDTIRMFRGLRSLGIPFLSIDHISKASKIEEKKGNVPDAYGSIYTMNAARLGWSLKRTVASGDAIVMRADNTKHNHVPKQLSQTIEIKYRNDEMGVPEFIDIEVGNELGMMMPTIGTHERIVMLIGGSETKWWSYEMLGDALGMKDDSLRKTVSRDQALDRPTFETKTEHRKTWVGLSVTQPLSQPVTDDVTEENSE